MGKFLLVILVLAVIGGGWWIKHRAKLTAGRKPPRLEAMLRCAHCGLHVPRSEALMLGEHAYCSAAHRERGPSRLSGRDAA